MPASLTNEALETHANRGCLLMLDNLDYKFYFLKVHASGDGQRWSEVHA